MAKPWQIILATIAIFLAGLVTGGVVAVRVVQMITRNRAEQRAQQAPAQIGPQRVRLSILPQLDLTDAERKKINPVLRRTAEEIARIRRDAVLKVDLANERMQDDIGSLLTSEQRAKFDSLMSDLRAQVDRENAARAERNSRLLPSPFRSGPDQSKLPGDASTQK